MLCKITVGLCWRQDIYDNEESSSDTLLRKLTILIVHQEQKTFQTNLRGIIWHLKIELYYKWDLNLVLNIILSTDANQNKQKSRVRNK